MDGTDDRELVGEQADGFYIEMLGSFVLGLGFQLAVSPQVLAVAEICPGAEGFAGGTEHDGPASWFLIKHIKNIADLADQLDIKKIQRRLLNFHGGDEVVANFDTNVFE